jgi:methylated-DNA-protein-cysteine methyltransferase related protein
MPKSPAFIRIKAQVLQIVAAIPYAKLTTFRSIGEHLDVVPRHVAYILTMLTIDEKIDYPWFRVVSDDASLGVPKHGADDRSQAELLLEEGLIVSGNSVKASFEQAFIPAGALESGISQQTRPPKPAKVIRQKSPSQ